MKKLLIIMFIFLCSSCALINDPPMRTVNISSDNVFSIRGEVFNYAKRYVPVTIYNPNIYSININVDGSDYIVEKYDSMRFE